MALPYATRCAIQALRESSDERAQDAYALLVQAFVSGKPKDIKAAEQALSLTNVVQFDKLSNLPTACDHDEFRGLHSSAVTTAGRCGVHLPEAVLSEQRANEAKTSVAYITVIVVLVMLCVVAHTMLQRCKPTGMCTVGR